jgi:hypothetical protein
MYSEPYACRECGMILTGSEELVEHLIAVHHGGQIQCQSCGKFFESRAAFDKHAEVHSDNSQTDLGEKHISGQSADDAESILLKRTMEEEKARKRTRGPYRKSSTA